MLHLCELAADVDRRANLGQTEDGISTWYRHWIAEGLAKFEADLAQTAGTGKFCQGDAASMADCCLVPQIFNAQRLECRLDQVVVGLVAFPTLGAAMVAPVAFAGITFLEGHFITPTIIGRRLALNALAVLLALAFWTWLWGPMGGFLSSPLLIVALILKEHLVPNDAPQLPE